MKQDVIMYVCNVLSTLFNGSSKVWVEGKDPPTVGQNTQIFLGFDFLDLKIQMMAVEKFSI